MWGRGSVRSRPVGASVRAASELRPRGTEKASASRVWERRAGAEGREGGQGGLRSPPARGPCRVSGSTVTKLLLPRPWFPHRSASGSATAWAGVHMCDSPSHQPPHVLTHTCAGAGRAPSPAPLCPRVPDSGPARPPHFRLTSAGGGGAAGSLGAGPSQPAPCSWEVPLGAWRWAAVGLLPAPSLHGSGLPRPRASLPALAVTSVLSGRCLSRDVREEGRRGHRGSVSPWVQPSGRCLIALVPSAAHLCLPTCIPRVGKR